MCSNIRGSCQLSLLGHMPNNKCGNVIGFGNLHEFSSDFNEPEIQNLERQKSLDLLIV